ncbi:MAG: thioredoxin family protein [Gammaproteobacteria bacterium]|nr:thioredoxin family protein [Gammaproteobacteria bacterium]
MICQSRWFVIVSFVAVLLLVPLLTAANEDTSSSITTPHLTARLVSEVEGIVPGQPFWVALHFDIIPDWHTYWQNPGDSGNPPTIDWSLPPGFSTSEIHWPYPQRLPVGPLMNYGYSDQAMLLVEITAGDKLLPGQTIELHANADWLVCKVECIPEEGRFSLSLAVIDTSRQTPSAWADAFGDARQRLPQPLPWPATIAVDATQLIVSIDMPGIDTSQLHDVYFYAADYGIVEHAADQPYSVNENSLTITLTRGDLRGQPLEQLDGVLLVAERAADGILKRAFTATIPAEPVQTSGDLGLILLFALAGGLLLNIMPCVFPILSLKALQIVQSAAQAPAAVRSNGVAFTLGVLISFAIIAALLLLLRASGEAIGWGFQLQSPVFVLILTWLLFAMALMFSGLWSFGESFMGMGQRLTSRQGNAGAFFTGVLAVIVATPCTAPFMGAALGYALSQSNTIALLIFIVLGFGMALPWLSISFWPGLSKRLPKPGPWMELTKQVLAFPLYATVAWLLWVLSQQVDQASLLVAFMSLVLLSFLLWCWQQLRTSTRLVYKAGLVLLLILSLAATLSQQQAPADANQQAPADWQAYDPVRLSEYQRDGHAVLVNFTAAWCITCLVNEKVAISQPAVQAQLRQRGVVYMKADWTNRDARITEMLSRYGRSGVPLYLLFPGDGQDAVVLPNILTEGILIDALQQVGTRVQ